MEESEKVITSEQTDIKGVVGQPEDKGGDGPQTSVTDEAVKEEKVVPLKALLAEQKKAKSEKELREQSERELDNLKADLVRLRMQAQQPKQDPFDGRDAYDPVTVAELKQRENQIKAEISNHLQLQRISESGMRAREKYKEEDFTFDDAYKIFQSSAFTDDERAAILNSADPRNKMYKYVKAHVADDKPAKKAQEIADQMTKNVTQAQTLSSTSKTTSKSFNKLKELQKMTPAEHRAYMDDILRQKRGG